MATVFVGIGSSVDRANSITQGVIALQKQFLEIHCSAVYESEAVGFEGVNFYNLVVKFTTTLPAIELIKIFKVIERNHGRAENAVKFAPRTLDLDLLLYDQLIDTSIDLPRGEIIKNAFVLQPLAELAPELQHPILQKNYQQLWNSYPKDNQKLWMIDFNLPKEKR